LTASTLPAVASFRDPAGRLFRSPQGLIRVIGPQGLPDFEAFSASRAARAFVADGRLVGARPLDAAARAALTADAPLAAALAADPGAVVEHERIALPTYPYEWPPEMLHAAGLLTLDLALAAFDEGLGLKDATPFNVLFRGPSPVFVDWLSVERRDPHDPTWLPYAQFVRTFLLPLVAHREFGLPLDQVFLSRRDGLEPEEVYRLAGVSKRLKPSLLAHATLPTWLSGRAEGTDERAAWKPRRIENADRARFVLRSVFTRLRRALVRLEPRASSSRWTEYMRDKTHYSGEDFSRKEAFVSQALADGRPRRVLDVGCNTGHFSALAARAGASVVALDGDPAVTGVVWRRAVAERADILPLIVNIARPTPATGWRNEECPSFLQRTRKSFDLVLMLAVLHHILVTERVPLDDVLGLAADLTTDLAVIEFVAPEDPMFRRIARGREHLHEGLTAAGFEAACAPHFEVVRRESTHPTRVLYLLRVRR
jgi:SAM-dependent methyltransferase